MKAIRRRVLIALALVLVGLGAVIAAAFTAPGGWLALIAYIVGAAAAWYLYGSAVQLGTARAKAALTARIKANPQSAENLKQWLENQTAAVKEEGQK